MASIKMEVIDNFSRLIYRTLFCLFEENNQFRNIYLRFQVHIDRKETCLRGQFTLWRLSPRKHQVKPDVFLTALYLNLQRQVWQRWRKENYEATRVYRNF